MAAHTCNMRRGAVASPVRGNHNVALVMSTHGAEQRLWVASSRSRCGQGGRWRRCTRSSCNGTILAPTAHVLARNAQNGSRWPANCVFYHIRLPASVRLTSMCSTRTASSYAAKLNGPHPAAASVKAPLSLQLALQRLLPNVCWCLGVWRVGESEGRCPEAILLQCWGQHSDGRVRVSTPH